MKAYFSVGILSAIVFGAIVSCTEISHLYMPSDAVVAKKISVPKDTVATCHVYTGPDDDNDEIITTCRVDWTIVGKKRSNNMDKSKFVNGEKFKVIYDSINPDNYVLMLNKPLFLSGEKAAPAQGMIVKATTYSCEFVYGPHLLFKHQFLSKDMLQKYPMLKPGSIFEVVYSPASPGRAIIYPDQPVVLKDSAYTTALCFDHGHVKGFHYEVNKVRYSVAGLPVPGVMAGDVFVVAYDTLRPDHATILYDHPVFPPTVRILKTTGTVTRISGATCTFTYKTGGTYAKEHIRMQVIPATYAALKKGDRFEVEYNASKPEHAIIYFNRVKS